jgi:hypothetical protein
MVELAALNQRNTTMVDFRSMEFYLPLRASVHLTAEPNRHGTTAGELLPHDDLFVGVYDQ